MSTIKIKSTVSLPYSIVKRAVVDKDGKLLKYLMPIGCKLLHYKGLRRGSITRVKIFNSSVTFKTITYSPGRDKTSFHDIFKDGTFLGIKFWSHRHKIISASMGSTDIHDEITFTTKNKLKDALLHVVIYSSFRLRSLQYKLFFKQIWNTK
jgi:hypothetical protein